MMVAGGNCTDSDSMGGAPVPPAAAGEVGRRVLHEIGDGDVGVGAPLLDLVPRVVQREHCTAHIIRVLQAWTTVVNAGHFQQLKF